MRNTDEPIIGKAELLEHLRLYKTSKNEKLVAKLNGELHAISAVEFKYRFNGSFTLKIFIYSEGKNGNNKPYIANIDYSLDELLMVIRSIETYKRNKFNLPKLDVMEKGELL